MPANVEIKARVPDLGPIRLRAALLSDAPEQVLHHEDTFFSAPSGRLKLRDFGDGRGELILYHRSDVAGPKVSNYLIAATGDPEAMRAILESTLGVLGVVRKLRRLYLVGQTRVHLDEVEGLGAFVELEVVLRPGQPEFDGEAIARDLMARLDIADDQLVEAAYIDLLRPGLS